MFRHLSTLRFRKFSRSSKTTTLTSTPVEVPGAIENPLSHPSWNQSSFSVTSSVFQAEFNGDHEWNARDLAREEDNWAYLDAEHIAAAVQEIAHGELFEYVNGRTGRELTQRSVLIEMTNQSGEDEEEEQMDPVFYADWLERHRDVVDEEGRFRDELEGERKGRKGRGEGERRGKKSLLGRLRSVLTRRKSKFGIAVNF